jgi:PAS domain-containing protein
MLQEAQNGIAAFMDASMDAFLLFDDKLNLVSINPAGERMLGISEENIKRIFDPSEKSAK